MTTYEIRKIIEQGLKHHGIEVTGGGSMLIEPYEADIDIKLTTGEEFHIVVKHREKK